MYDLKFEYPRKQKESEAAWMERLEQIKEQIMRDQEELERRVRGQDFLPMPTPRRER
jgi:hypothetical protein